MNELYWTSLPGLHKKLKWPVKVTDWDEGHADMVTVYCHSDNAVVKKSQLVPFENSEILKEKGICALKKRKETLQAFKDDIRWAQVEIAMAEDESSTRLPVPEREHISESESEQELLQDAPDHVSNSGSSEDESSTRPPVPEPEHISDSESEQELLQDAPDHVSNSGSSEDESSTRPPVPEREHISDSEPEQELLQDAPDHVSNSGSSEDESSTRPPVPEREHISESESEQELLQDAPDHVSNSGSSEDESSTRPPVPEREHISDSEPEQELLQDAPDHVSNSGSSEDESSTRPPVPEPEHISDSEPEQELLQDAPDHVSNSGSSEDESSTRPPVPEREHISDSEPEQELLQDAPDHVSNSGSSEDESSTRPPVPEREHISESESEQELLQDAPDHVSNSGSSEDESSTRPPVPEREHISESESEQELLQDAPDHVSNSGSSEDESSMRLPMPERELISESESEQEQEPKKRVEVTEGEIVRDSVYPEVYIRKHLKSSNSTSGQAYKKKNSRVYNNYHACLYCEELFLHIPVHMKVHRNVLEVRDEFKKPKPNFTTLRKLGDDKHNRNVVDHKKGELIIARKSNDKTLDITKYGPCVKCREWCLLSGLKKHFRRCAKGEKERLGKRDLVIQAQILAGHVIGKPSKMMLEEVYRIMKDDDCSRTAKNDILILSLGESWLRRNLDNYEKRKYYASGRMRLCARLLIALQDRAQQAEKENEGTHKTMWDFLVPSKFDDFVAASLVVSMPCMDDMEDLRAPSNALKLKYDIRRLLNAKYAYLLRMASDVDSNEIKGCKRFLKLMEIEWSERVTKVARTVLQTRRLTETREIPAPDDVEKLTKHLVHELQTAKMTPENYARIVQLCQTRLLLFNKRRSGELEVLNLQSYLQRSSSLSDLDESISKDLTDVEKHLLESQGLVMIRGKRGRAVPVIVPQDANKPLEFITNAEARQAAGVQRSNKYLFPNRGTQYVRAYDSLKSVCDEVTLKAPARITSVSMRKYMATLTQLMGLDKYQMDWVCKHLGHTKSVHNTAYRQMSGMIERVYISKLLMVQDLNLTGKFKGQNLEDIDVSELLAEHQSLAQESDAVAERDVVAEPDAVTSGDIATHMEYNSGSDIETGDNESSSDSEVEPPSKKRRHMVKTTTRQKWSVDEVSEIQKYFKAYLDTGVTPRNKEVQLALAKSKKNQGILWMRKTHLIIKKISNMNKDKR